MSKNDTRALRELPRYIYGTTRLGDESLSLQQRRDIADKAMASCTWFHVSEQYGSALALLGEQFRSSQAPLPRTIFKMEVHSPDEYPELVERHLQTLGVASMDIGQLCLRDRKAADFVDDSDTFEILNNLRSRGKVERYVMEVFPWTANIALHAIESGCLDDLVEGLIFYFNPLQRFASNALWSQIQERQIPVIAMRSVCGARVHDLRDIPGVAWQPYLQQRAAEVAPIFERSGESDWARFCLRYVLNHPFVRASVGATANAENLKHLQDAAETATPLPEETVEELANLQHRWAEGTDAQARPWSM